MLKVSLVALLATAQFAQPGCATEVSAVTRVNCDRDCLSNLIQNYLASLRKRDPSELKMTPAVRFVENGVEMPVGEGVWGSITNVAQEGLTVSDPLVGQVGWFGHAEENGIPIYLAVRLRIDHGAISESETIVSRSTGLPLPYGDPRKLVHYSSFTEAVPPERRKARERMIAIADAYFSTLELNDGHVFAPLAADCKRIENGVVTTKSSAKSAAGSLAEGCDAQFKLGIYKINKRIRERRYPLVDVERGIVLATATFDHANDFDEYQLTNGKTMKTLLKWPNSISVMEVFKIIDGKIVDLEAMFDYVPYGMRSPFQGEGK